MEFISENRSNPRIAKLSKASAVLSIAACYVPMALIVVLSLMGITLAINEQVWAGTIVAFALLAVVGIAVATRARKKPDAFLVGMVGALLVVLSMYGADFVQTNWGIHARLIEAVGFLGLLYAVWRVNR